MVLWLTVCFCLLWSAEAPAHAPVHFQVEHEFVEGQCKLLKTKIRAREATWDKRFTLLEVEVTNKGSVFAEPLEFRVRWKSKAGRQNALVPRVAPPHFGRAGRAVPPGETLSYPLIVAVANNDSNTIRLEVSRASFFQASPESNLSKPPVEVRRLEAKDSKHTLQGDEVSVTSLLMRNNQSAPVEAILRVELGNPRKGTALISLNLPGSSQELFTLEYVHLLATGRDELWGAPILKAKVVDWSLLFDDGGESELKQLHDALHQLAIWGDGYGFQAEYQLTQTTKPAKGKSKTRVGQGSFSLKNDQPLAQFQAHGTEQTGSQELQRMSQLLVTLFDALHGNLLPNYLKPGEVALHTKRGDQRTFWVNLRKGTNTGLFRIEEGQLVSIDRGPQAHNGRLHLRIQDLPHSQLITRITIDRGLGEHNDWLALEYSGIDEHMVPVRMELVEHRSAGKGRFDRTRTLVLLE